MNKTPYVEAVRMTVIILVMAIPLAILAALVSNSNTGRISNQVQEGQKPEKGTTSDTSQVPNKPRLISSTATSEVVSAEGQLFWIDKRNGGHSLYGYDPGTQQEYLISDAHNGALTSNGEVITWLVAPDSDVKSKVQRYDPVSKEQRTIATIQLPWYYATSFEGFPKIAADTNTIYYVRHDPSDPGNEELGLNALDLASGRVHLVTRGDIGEGPVAADGVLVWPAVTYIGTSPFRLSHTKLHAVETNGTDHILVDADGTTSGGYATSGGRVVWVVGGGPDPRIYLADLHSGETKPISGDAPIGAVDPVYYPRISGNIVAWVGTPDGASDPAEPWSLVVYDITSDSRRTVLKSRNDLNLKAIIGQDAVAYLSYHDQGLELYLVSIK